MYRMVDMKRKYIARDQWKRIKSSNCVLLNKYQERFKGYASAIFVEKVHDKLVCNLGSREICLVERYSRSILRS